MDRTSRWITAGALWAVGAVAVSCSAQSQEQRPLAQTSQARGTGAVVALSLTDWPRFRGPTGIGSSPATELPMSWSQNESILWKTPLPGAGASSPVIFGDHIYLTAYTGYLVPGEAEGSLDKLERHLLCLDRETGMISWQKSVKAKLPEEERVRDHGYAANTPAADADAVYVFFGKSGVIAFDHDGEHLWQADVGSGTSGWGTAASPVLYGDLVIINASVEGQSLVALDRRTGEEVWRAGGINEAWNTPLVVTTDAGAEELVVAIHGKVLGFEPSSGERLWSCDTDITWYMVPSPVAADGVVYYLGGRSGTAVLAVRTGGRGDVTRTHRLWTSNKGSNVTSPVYHDGYLYWTHEQSGIAYCARAEDGELIYEERLERGGQFYASSLVADGRVYHLNRQGKMFVLAARPEFEQLSVNDLSDGSQFNATPALTGNRLLLRSDRFLYCIGE
jgi:outer membrane protein assembly factor BamB